jgi:hypothetical protein
VIRMVKGQARVFVRKRHGDDGNEGKTSKGDG